MNERQVRKVQKNRHMNDILLMIASSSIFKNLNDRDRRKMARLIYKAECIEMYVRNQSILRMNASFQEIVAAAMSKMDFDFEDEEDDEDEEDR